MLETFGARLRQRREEQQIALITIADQTRIKLSLLEALERDDVSLWPAGIFRRAFIRTYAHAIGLNPDVVVREFLEVYPEPIEIDVTGSAMASGADGARASGGPPIRLRYLVDSAIGSLSRLRRGPAVADPAVDGSPAVRPTVASGPDLPAEAPPLEPGRADTAKKMAADRAQVNEPEHPAVAHPSSDAAQFNGPNQVIGSSATANAPAPFEPDVLAAANLCTEFGLVENTNEVQPLLEEAARILDAIGLIVWVWDSVASELRPALAQGYSDKVLAQVPTVRHDADNATAAAFRSAQTCAINGGEHTSGALVVPLLTPAGCAGVLAIELQHGAEQTRSVRAVATIFAAQLAQLIGGVGPAEVRPQGEVVVPPVENFMTPMLRGRVRG